MTLKPAYCAADPASTAEEKIGRIVAVIARILMLSENCDP